MKDYKEHKYTYKYDIKKYLKDRNMTEEEAIGYIEASLPYKRTWKMWRFTLYLWARIDNELFN